MSYTGLFLIYKANGYPTNVYYDNVNESGVVPPPPIPRFRVINTGEIREINNNNLRIVSP